MRLPRLEEDPYRLPAIGVDDGYEIARSRHPARDFMDAAAGVEITGEETGAQLPKLAHDPLLIAAERDDAELAVPWPGGKRSRLSLG